MANVNGQSLSNQIDALLRQQSAQPGQSGSIGATFEMPFGVVPFDGDVGSFGPSGSLGSTGSTGSLPPGIEVDAPHPRFDDDLTIPAFNGTAAKQGGTGSGISGDTGTFIDVSYEGPFDDGDTIGNVNGSAGTIVVDGSINGVTDYAGDQDRYAITVAAGQTVQFTTAGASYNGASPTPDTTLTLFDASGNQLAFNDDANGLYSQNYTYVCYRWNILHPGCILLEQHRRL